jgi:predicted acylesterase/phospholipase RssA
MQVDYENLVFEGGGVCSFAYCGAIFQLEKMGILSKIKRFAGSSIGALFAGLLAADFTAREIWEVQTIINFGDLSNKYDVSNAFNLFKNLGVNSSSSIRKQINAILSTRISRDETLSGLFEKTGKELVLVSCCLNTEKAVYFHHATHGNIKVIDAIIASMSIPVFFRPLQLSLFNEEYFFVDGAIVDNYPIWIFNDIDALYKNKITSFDRENVNPLTLGLKLNNHGQKLNGSNSKTPVTNIIDLLCLMGNILAGVVDSNNYSNKYKEQTIKISNSDVYFLDLFITKDHISQLVKNGIEGVKNYFNNSSC